MTALLSLLCSDPLLSCHSRRDTPYNEKEYLIDSDSWDTDPKSTKSRSDALAMPQKEQSANSYRHPRFQRLIVSSDYMIRKVNMRFVEIHNCLKSPEVVARRRCFVRSAKSKGFELANSQLCCPTHSPLQRRGLRNPPLRDHWYQSRRKTLIHQWCSACRSKQVVHKKKCSKLWHCPSSQKITLLCSNESTRLQPE